MEACGGGLVWWGVVDESGTGAWGGGVGDRDCPRCGFVCWLMCVGELGTETGDFLCVCVPDTAHGVCVCVCVCALARVHVCVRLPAGFVLMPSRPTVSAVLQGCRAGSAVRRALTAGCS